MKFFIHKASRLAKSPYAGPACEDAGVPSGKEYDSQQEAMIDAKKLTEVNPVGFVVSPLDGEYH